MNLESLKSYFRPEFLNRLDEIIIFDILSPETIREIVTMQVGEVVKRLAVKIDALVVENLIQEVHAASSFYNAPTVYALSGTHSQFTGGGIGRRAGVVDFLVQLRLLLS